MDLILEIIRISYSVLLCMLSCDPPYNISIGWFNPGAM